MPVARAAYTMSDLRAYDPEPQMSGGQLRFKCCFHGGDHQRSLAVNPETGQYFCHNGTCRAAGVLTEYASPIINRDRRSHARTVRQPLIKPKAPREPDPKRQAALLDNLQTLRPVMGTAGESYLSGRNIPREIISSNQVRFSPGWGKIGAAVVFPLRSESGELVKAAARSIKGSGKQILGDSVEAVYSTSGAWAANVVAVTEAPIDALSLAAAGMPAIALCGVSVPSWLPYKLMFKTVYVATDADGAGDKLADKLQQLLGIAGANYRRFRPPDDVKDWNGELMRSGSIELPKTALHVDEPGDTGHADVQEDQAKSSATALRCICGKKMRPDRRIILTCPVCDPFYKPARQYDMQPACGSCGQAAWWIDRAGFPHCFVCGPPEEAAAAVEMIEGTADWKIPVTSPNGNLGLAI